VTGLAPCGWMGESIPRFGSGDMIERRPKMLQAPTDA
jgi:hypothetical protein